MNDGFSKIDLQNTVTEKITSPKVNNSKRDTGNTQAVIKMKSKKSKKIPKVILGIIILIFILGVVMFFPARNLYREIQKKPLKQPRKF